MAAAVGQVIDIAECLAGILQTEGTAGVIKEQALAFGERINVHVVVFIADLGGQVGRHQLAVLDDIVHFAHDLLPHFVLLGANQSKTTSPWSKITLPSSSMVGSLNIMSMCRMKSWLSVSLLPRAQCT